MTPAPTASAKERKLAERRANRAAAQRPELLAKEIADRQARVAAKHAIADAARPGTGEVVLVTADELRFVHAKLDDGYMHREGGYGGWSDVERPGRVSATVFTGTSSLRLPLRLVLGGWPTDPARSGVRCEEAIRMLEAFARQPLDARRGTHPPLLRVRGAVPHGDALWFVDELTWASEPDETILVRGSVVRTAVAVTLKRYAGVELIAVGKPRPEPLRVHVVRRGEDVETIARKRCGAVGPRAVKQVVGQIKRLNGLRDGRRISPGQRLRLPPL